MDWCERRSPSPRTGAHEITCDFFYLPKLNRFNFMCFESKMNQRKNRERNILNNSGRVFNGHYANLNFVGFLLLLLLFHMCAHRQPANIASKTLQATFVCERAREHRSREKKKRKKRQFRIVGRWLTSIKIIITDRPWVLFIFLDLSFCVYARAQKIVGGPWSLRHVQVKLSWSPRE